MIILERRMKEVRLTQAMFWLCTELYLRQNYESKLRYEESRNFYKREKELSRRDNTRPSNAPFQTAYMTMSMKELLEMEESNEIEFKPRLLLENKTKGLNRVQIEFLQNIGSFMNMEAGGVLVLGFRKDRTVCGIEDDFNAFPPERQNIDNWTQYVDTFIESHIGTYYTQYMKVQSEIYCGKRVIRIQVTQAQKPSYIKYTDPSTQVHKNEFYIRSNGRSIPLNGIDVIDYVKEHWVL
jgi:predicted HTH transcriptional regulator